MTTTGLIPRAAAHADAVFARAMADVIFLGWFGPRGLASVVFALLAMEQFDGLDDALGLSVSAVVLTVLLSVVLHGITAGPAGSPFDTPEGGQTPTDDGTQPRPRASRVLTD